MTTSPENNLRVAIVGGGMCGLLCAIGLIKAGIHVDVFEQAPKFGEVGAGVGLGPNALFPLEQLGVLKAVLSRADEVVPTTRSFEFISCYGRHESIYNYPANSDDFGLGIYRNVLPSFLEAIIPMLDPSILHLGRRCVSVSTSPTKAHILNFADGSTHEADLIVGTDGIRSVVREFVSGRGQSESLAYSNSIAYRAVVPTKVLKDAGVKADLTRPLCWIGDDKHIISFPIQAQRLMNMVYFSTDSTVPIGSVDVPAPWVEAASQEEILHRCSDWGEDAITVLKEMKNPSKWHLHFLRPLSTYVQQRVVLVGDAAHAMLPHLGAGVGQGFEDVYALCSLLKAVHFQECDLDAALDAYDKIRVPRTNMVHTMSTVAGDIYEGRGVGGKTIPQLREQLIGIWKPIWHHDLKEEVKRTVASISGGKGSL